MEDKVGLTIRITVKLRPDEYDELFAHVCQIGSTMSAFLRDSAAKALSEHRQDRSCDPSFIEIAGPPMSDQE
jgi:hypothetical protein